MKKLFAVVIAVMFLASFAFAQTAATVTQSGAANTADVWQSDAGPSNVGGTTSTIVDQTAGTYNEVEIKQLGRKSDIEVMGDAGTYNDMTIYQRGNYDNHFYVNQTATTGYNAGRIELGQAGGGDIHDNDYFIDQTASGNNDLEIYSRGNHVYSHNKIDVDQTATAGNNSAYIDMDGDWRRNVNINTDQTSMDNTLDGLVRGESVDVDINQTASGINSADFDVMGNNVTLDVMQNTSAGDNVLTSYQEKNSSATVSQTSTLGGNTATINQH